MFSYSTCSTVEQDCLPPLESSGQTTGPPSAQQQRIPVHKPFTQSRLPPDLPMHPAPRHITEEELRVLESCLHRWRSEVENDTHGRSNCLSFTVRYYIKVRIALTSVLCIMLFPPDLQGSITRIQRTIELMYSDKSMMQVSRLSCDLLYLQYKKWQQPISFFYQYYKPPLCCTRFHTGFMQCWSMKARQMPATTGLTSMTHINVAGWSTMISLSQSHPGRSWFGTHLEAIATLVHTVSCISMTESSFS